MPDGFAVDRAALTETAQGLREVIGALQGLGFDETAQIGRGFSGLALSQLQAGDADLAGAFEDFCDRWSWGVRSLVQDGNQFAGRLGLAAGLYNDVENQITGAMKDVVVAGVGDPHMTGAGTPGGGMTWEQAGQSAEEQWEGVGRAAVGSPGVKVIEDLIGGR